MRNWSRRVCKLNKRSQHNRVSRGRGCVAFLLGIVQRCDNVSRSPEQITKSSCEVLPSTCASDERRLFDGRNLNSISKQFLAQLEFHNSPCSSIWKNSSREETLSIKIPLAPWQIICSEALCNLDFFSLSLAHPRNRYLSSHSHEPAFAYNLIIHFATFFPSLRALFALRLGFSFAELTARRDSFILIIRMEFAFFTSRAFHTSSVRESQRLFLSHRDLFFPPLKRRKVKLRLSNLIGRENLF